MKSNSRAGLLFIFEMYSLFHYNHFKQQIVQVIDYIQRHKFHLEKCISFLDFEVLYLGDNAPI